MLVTITNVSTVQQYVSMIYHTINVGESVTVSRTTVDLEREVQLKQMVVDGLVSLAFQAEATDSIASTEGVAAKYVYAATKPTIHMEVDFEGLTALSPLAGGALQSAANARANVMKAAWNSHLAGVGTVHVDGEHKTADATNVVSAADASNLATCITLINALLAAVIGHGDETGVHFLNDTGTGGTGASITVDPPVTLANCITDLNDLKLAMQTHFSAGSIAL